MANTQPDVGAWYRRPGGNLAEVVAIDEEDGTVEIQHFDGTVEEVDMESWDEMMFESAHPPEDWSGSLDIDPEDYRVDEDLRIHNDWANPLDYLDLTE